MIREAIQITHYAMFSTSAFIEKQKPMEINLLDTQNIGWMLVVVLRCWKGVEMLRKVLREAVEGGVEEGVEGGRLLEV